MVLSRSWIVTAVLGLGALAVAPTSALAVPATPAQQPAGHNVAHEAAVRAWQAFETRAAARLRPHTALAQSSLAQSATGTPFGPITNVEQISRDTLPASSAEIEPDTQTEPAVAIDPFHPSVMTADFQQGRDGPFGGSQAPGYATSLDGGRTWADGNLPLLTTATGGPFQLASDTAVAFGPDGSTYAQTIPFDETDARSAVAVQRSTDRGITFGPPSLVVDDNNINIFNDKNWIAVDDFPHSPFFGRIYTVWSRFITTGSGANAVTNSPGAVSVSNNHGRTWSPLRFASAATADTEGLIPLVHPDGSVTIVYDLFVPDPANPNGGSDFETAQTSRDGGRTWSAPVTIGQFEGSEVPGMRTGGLPTAAIDPVTGDLYVAWQDTRFNAAGLNDIVLSVSTDGGSTWSTPRSVSPRAAGLDRFTPAVAADNGAVIVSYRTRGDDGNAPTVTENFVISPDRGRVFSREFTAGPPTVLADAAVSDEAPPPVAFLGDYMGLAMTGREAELIWCVASQPPGTETFHQTAWGATLRR